ncbi:glucosylceramidase [Chryseotalea sanaruensis]|uniref:Glucosylceramidase n=1 Tax=Chryseotalea sanaruensis TaxID=2482724 RepID=A0A401UB01_9BACT|nr:glycoside hydrolase family 30 beta sandwich domain-containing protein [Chryseotalea sanaruensis]GCC52060.1 glucosylceramidase [Chryseotalea sanaruensis]
MKINFYGQLLAIALGVVLFACRQKSKEVTIKADGVEQWITTVDKKSLLAKIDIGEVSGDTTILPKIIINEAQQYQTIDGFGYSLTGGSAYLLHTKLDAATRAALLKELFLSDGNNIGISYLRISIGASDLDDHVFSYNDLPAGKTDKALTAFTLAEDEKHLIPILKEIIQLAPDIKIMGSPWSAPVWMKDNNSPKGGNLKTEYYAAYADYFVKYITGMAAHGITLDAITIQNEPENPKNKPSMVMTAREQADFVKLHLGPAFEKAGIKTKIIVFDHNCDHPEYPIEILNDADAKKYVDGSAFHLYLGEIEALSKVHDAHPDKHVYFTEQWTSPEGTFDGDLMWHTRELIVGATRNWSRNVLEWNLAADPQFNPHTDDGGCTMCQGALTIGDSIARNVSYYIIAQASKFVRPGSVRVASNEPDSLHNVAFVTPEGKTVLIVVNEASVEKKFAVKSNNKNLIVAIPAGAVATYTWE